MTDRPPLLPATEAEVLQSIGFALQHKGKRAFKNADGFMAEIAAAHLLEHLQASGFVLMKRPPAAAHGAPAAYGEHMLGGGNLPKPKP